MKREPRWITKSAALAIHERLLAEHGGFRSPPDEGSLEAALARPRSHFAYKECDIFQLAAAYAYAITRNHPFKDGNKRLALTLAGVFLEINGYQLNASESEAVTATSALSTRLLEEEGYADWLRQSSARKRARKQPAIQPREATRPSPRKKK